MAEATSYGIISLIPPIIAIVLALRTKNTLFSLFIAIWVGATIIAGYNPFVGFIDTFSVYMTGSIASSWNAGLLLLVTFASGFVYTIRAVGASDAFATFITQKINTAKKAQVLTWCSAFIFSYTEPCLILGTIMRPVTDRLRVSRAKLAYILDSMGCNLACFSPISSYGPFITGLLATQITANGLAHLEGTEWSLYVQVLPFNMYGLFAMITVLIVILSGLDIGPMYAEEKRARTTGKLMADGVIPIIEEKKANLPEGYVPTIKNFAIPLGALFLTIFSVIFYTGDISTNGFAGAFINGNITVAITSGFIVGAMAGGFVGVATGLFNFTDMINGYVGGIKELIMVPFILVMAWSMGSITSVMGIGTFLTEIVEAYLVSGLVPGLLFLCGAAISFATGSSWGVWTVLMPIAFPMAIAFDISIPFTCGAVIAGGLFGDQCSPISDTTINSSTGAAINHIVHVQTQIPYGLTVGAASFIAFLVGGFTKQYFLSMLIGFALLIVFLFGLSKYAAKKYVNVDQLEVDA